MLVLIVRAFFVYVFAIFVMRIMGKREIGQLQPYEFAITLMTKSDRWFFEISLPTTLVVIVLITISVFFYKVVSKSMIATALYLFIDVAFLSIALECYIDKFRGIEVNLFWSAIVFSVCAVISVALIAILSIRRLRVTVQKRLHF